MLRPSTFLVLGAALAWELGAAYADEASACDDPRISVGAHVDGRWVAPIARACQRTHAAADGDPTARVRIIPAGADLIVEVELEDGRSALRRVRDIDLLGPTLEALLVLPPRAPAAAAPAPLPTVAISAAIPPTAPSTRGDAHAHPTANLDAEGGSGALRIAGREAYLSLAPALFANLRVGPWLFGIEARWDAFQSEVTLPAPGFEMETLGSGLSVARRFRPRFGTLDVGVAPRLLAETQSFLQQGNEVADTQTDVRIGTFARLAVGDATLRFFVGVDFELSPGRIRRRIRIDPALPPLPSWSSGLTAGIVWGEP
ncbi:MAG: hypothetical protein HOO96_28825 [Polyangiaceae bacterium]|nr:hypothetical protein [Polyangiaceae bacterium]